MRFLGHIASADTKRKKWVENYYYQLNVIEQKMCKHRVKKSIFGSQSNVMESEKSIIKSKTGIIEEKKIIVESKTGIIKSITVSSSRKLLS